MLSDLFIDVSSILQSRVLSEECSSINGAQIFNCDQSRGEIELDHNTNDSHHSFLTFRICQLVARLITVLNVEKDELRREFSGLDQTVEDFEVVQVCLCCEEDVVILSDVVEPTLSVQEINCNLLVVDYHVWKIIRMETAVD